jgi:t-SNARE complex subunit (syntaxin)
MGEINSIAKDLALETHKQGEKLERLDENMTKVDENAEEALAELTQAQVHQKKSGKCMYFLVGIIVTCLIIMAVFLATAGSSETSGGTSA